MLDSAIRFSLRNRLLVVVGAALLLTYGGKVVSELPVDVFPDLNRPTVTVLAEAGGLSPEDVESLVVRPLEMALAGTPGVERVRTVSGVGLAILYVELDWGADIYLARQQVTERLQVAEERLPREVRPQMGPVTSIIGEILLVGLSSKEDKLSPMDLSTLAYWWVRPRVMLKGSPGPLRVVTQV